MVSHRDGYFRIFRTDISVFTAAPLRVDPTSDTLRATFPTENMAQHWHDALGSVEISCHGEPKMVDFENRSAAYVLVREQRKRRNRHLQAVME